MDSAAEIEREDAALGSWPRRLLHIPTMVSYEWQPGSRYGSYVEPSYNAITYTWGRWKLSGHERPDVSSIVVHGIPWEVPRVNPDHFTVQQFQNVLKKTTERVSHWMLKHISASVEFLWLDVACIDQRGTEPRSAAEIGRQAAIFKGAQNVFAWLSTMPITDLERILASLDTLSDVVRIVPFGTTPAASSQQLTTIHDHLSQLFKDHWFSSLWTLQETFLRQDVVLLSQEGTAVALPGMKAGSTYSPTFFDLISFCECMYLPNVNSSEIGKPYPQILELIEASGIMAIASQNAMAAYAAVGHRTSVKAEDRVYGMQQMFGFRLGITASCPPPKPFYTLGELEDQLREQLLLHYPVLSQLHVFTEPAARGRGWHVSQKSMIPDMVWSEGNPAWPTPDEQEEARCSFSVRNVDSRNWGYFEGPLCKFSEFAEACTAFEESNAYPGHYFAENNFLTLYMDRCVELSSSPHYQSSTYHRTPEGRQQRDLARWLCETFNDNVLHILLLGPRSSEVGRSRVMLGLILLRSSGQSFDHYRRLGFCYWLISHTTMGGDPLPGHDFFDGRGESWRPSSGLFG
ncbi:hypothetical protein EDB80DRAFT_727763 [Ilyonectria destructans]|nr:hypothetical protein EDB80DRAFT_727763 [Ilyonectria destructans]